MTNPSQINLFEIFNTASFGSGENVASSFGEQTSNQDKPKTTSISVRVTEEEKAALQAMAGTMALAHFIRKRLFEDEAEKRPKHYAKKKYQPSLEAKDLAQLLGMFGQSELATAVLALSLAATQGNLEVTDEVEEKIECACDDIETIKKSLILALSIKPQSESGS